MFSGIDFKPQYLYCGIGKDIEERVAWHKTEYIKFIETNSRESAGAVEEEINKTGFNTASQPGNGDTEESVFVYIYPITPYTR